MLPQTETTIATAGTIALVCPKCSKTLQVARDETDPVAAARIEVMCPDCSGGDFSMPEYFDAAGQQILDF
ncbi:MAG: hypothetical protein C0522_14280 [Rhodocyclaceae bacterium]|jgi:Zn finger protein HypA/HybF involved in hydrogenase expression|nr:hypothetical protein [Rhodocyclaceae bacterium]